MTTAIEDRTAIVTGSSSGVGRAIALLFASQGARLIVCADIKPYTRTGGIDQDSETATHELICRRYGDSKSVFVKTNVSVGSDVDACVREAVRLGGRLDM